jgi:DnaJ-class molecular chaperone
VDALGLPLGAPMSDVHAAYRQRAAEVHPDRHIRSSAAVRKLMEQQFGRVGLAVNLHSRYAELIGGAQ